MDKEYEATLATMGVGEENMGTGSGVSYILSLPFLSTTSERVHSEQHVRLEKCCKNKRIRLEEALCGLREESRFNHGVQFRVFVSGKQQILSPEQCEQMYFVSREAVENAFRHSAATAVEVEVIYTGRALRVFVRDNGCGMDQQAVRSGRNPNRGLLEMRERTESVGGQFRIWSKLSAGTEVEVSVPLSTAIAN